MESSTTIPSSRCESIYVVIHLDNSLPPSLEEVSTKNPTTNPRVRPLIKHRKSSSRLEV